MIEADRVCASCLPMPTPLAIVSDNAANILLMETRYRLPLYAKMLQEDYVRYLLNMNTSSLDIELLILCLKNWPNCIRLGKDGNAYALKGRRMNNMHDYASSRVSSRLDDCPKSANHL